MRTFSGLATSTLAVPEYKVALLDGSGINRNGRKMSLRTIVYATWEYWAREIFP